MEESAGSRWAHLNCSKFACPEFKQPLSIHQSYQTLIFWYSKPVFEHTRISFAFTHCSPVLKTIVSKGLTDVQRN